jgi:DNA topoisomerase-3
LRSRGRRAGEQKAVEPPAALVDSLRAWRLKEARRRRVPAFRIFPDRTLLALAVARPSTEDDLLAVPGIGAALASRYGAELLALCRGA